MRLAGLLGANAVVLCVGLGMLPMLGVARTWRELVARSGLAYLLGLALVGIVAAHLALVRVAFGWLALAVLAAMAATAGWWRLRGTPRPGFVRPRVATLVGTAAVVALIVDYARAFAVAPLNRYDAWAIWTFKGRALWDFGWADPTVFAAHAYRFANLDYPLLLPSLEALDFRAMGAFDTRLLHLQFLLLLVAGVAAVWALLRDLVHPFVLWAALLAIVAAPAVFDQLLTAYADVPLALFFAVGATAACRWLVTNERWPIVVAVVCFGAALLTKNEGSLFVLAAFVALALAAGPRRWRPLALAAAADLAVLLPWRIYTGIYGLHNSLYSLGDSFDVHHVSSRAGVGPIAFRTLGSRMLEPTSWGFTIPLFAAAALGALVLGARRLAVYGIVLALLSWLGLSWIYVVAHIPYGNYLDSTKDRVVCSVVIACAALTPLFLAEAWRASARGRVLPRTGDGRRP